MSATVLKGQGLCKSRTLHSQLGLRQALKGEVESAGRCPHPPGLGVSGWGRSLLCRWLPLLFRNKLLSPS